MTRIAAAGRGGDGLGRVKKVRSAQLERGAVIATKRGIEERGCRAAGGIRTLMLMLWWGFFDGRVDAVASGLGVGHACAKMGRRGMKGRMKRDRGRAV